MKATDPKQGRPKTKADARYFKLAPKADAVLETEHDRTGKTYTTIVEQALIYIGSLKPAVRDQLLSNLGN